MALTPPDDSGSTIGDPLEPVVNPAGAPPAADYAGPVADAPGDPLDALRPARALLSGGMTVPTNVPCHRCAYNLRGLAVGGLCPECAAPVDVSLAGDALQFADPEWLSRLSKGARVGITCYQLLPVYFFVSISGGWIFGGPFNWMCLLVLFGISFFLLVLGIWRFTTPHPLEKEPTGWRTRRARVRIALVAMAITTLVTVGVYTTVGPTEALLWLQLLGGPLGLAGFVATMSLCAYCRGLGTEVRSELASARSRLYARVYGISWVFFAAGMSVTIVAAPVPMFAPGGILMALVGGPTAAPCITAPAAIGVLASGSLTLLLPAMLQEEIEKNRRWAEAIWTAATEEAKSRNTFAVDSADPGGCAL